MYYIMKIVAINSSLSRFLPERAILMSERNRGNSIKPTINTVEKPYPIKNYNRAHFASRSGFYDRLDSQVAKGEKHSHIQSRKRSPLLRYD